MVIWLDSAMRNPFSRLLVSCDLNSGGCGGGGNTGGGRATDCSNSTGKASAPGRQPAARAGGRKRRPGVLSSMPSGNLGACGNGQ